MSAKLKFEEALNRLEEIARILESGSASLDESVKLYEEGTRLIQLCASRLNDAESKILKLSKDAAGTFSAEPLDGGTDRD